MARVVEPGQEARRTSLSSYPWHLWTDGQRWEVFQNREGEERDFHVSLKSFRLYLYNYKEMINVGLAPQPGEDVPPRDLTAIPQWKVETDIVPATRSVQFRFVPTGETADHSASRL